MQSFLSDSFPAFSIHRCSRHLLLQWRANADIKQNLLSICLIKSMNAKGVKIKL
jgi:hypothetical protein